jgi:hypothetical protein
MKCPAKHEHPLGKQCLGGNKHEHPLGKQCLGGNIFSKLTEIIMKITFVINGTYSYKLIQV